jgi:hypothetical protein
MCQKPLYSFCGLRVLNKQVNGVIMSKSLFLLKIREDYSADPSYSGSYQIATGMYNSARFVTDMLNANGRESDVGLLLDANSIDAAVMAYEPTHVFIEGLWVTPAKMAELMALPRHAGRQWIIRIHSEIPFIATEGVAMGWIAEYLALGVIVAPNAPRAHQQVAWMAQNLNPPVDPVIGVPLLSNYYPLDFQPLTPLATGPVLKIGLFGAFRVLKNHLNQAFAAARYAQSVGKTLELHVNDRIDAGGSPVAKNVTQLYDAISVNAGATIVHHAWEDRATFLATMASMDLNLQISISETFNIVAADSIYAGTPILVSAEVPWSYPFHADPQNVDDMIEKMGTAVSSTFLLQKNRSGLTRYAKATERRWLAYLPA